MSEVLTNKEGELKREQELHIDKLNRCTDVREAQAEIIYHFARVYKINEKYQEHEKERKL